MFYSEAMRTRQHTRTDQLPRTGYIVAPTCSDSDMEVEDDVLEDDDSLDPDFLLNLPDDLTPTTSGKQ